MVHFDFIVSEEDAQNIFDCIQHEIDENNSLISELMIYKKDDSVANCYVNRNKYLEMLKSKMLNREI